MILIYSQAGNPVLEEAGLEDLYTGVGRRKFIVVHREKYKLINKNTRINSVLHTHNCKATFANPYVLSSNVSFG